MRRSWPRGNPHRGSAAIPPTNEAVWLLALGSILAACSTTPILTIDKDSAQTGGAGGSSATSGVGAGSGASGGSIAEGGAGTGGTQGGEAGQPCNAATQVFAVKDGDGRCLARGARTTVAGNPAYYAVMGQCDGGPDVLWQLTEDDGAFELRNVGSNYNLDIRFAATADGTPAVLYSPHQLYNQRFYLALGAPSGSPLEPRHAPGKCLTRVDASLEIQPCDDASAEQIWYAVPTTCD